MISILRLHLQRTWLCHSPHVCEHTLSHQEGRCNLGKDIGVRSYVHCASVHNIIAFLLGSLLLRLSSPQKAREFKEFIRSGRVQLIMNTGVHNPLARVGVFEERVVSYLTVIWSGRNVLEWGGRKGGSAPDWWPRALVPWTIERSSWRGFSAFSFKWR